MLGDYIGIHADTPVFQLQEATRVTVAKQALADPDADRGLLAIAEFEQLAVAPDVPSEFRGVIVGALDTYRAGVKSARSTAAALYMWPRTCYPPWVPTKLSADGLRLAEMAIAACSWTVRLVDGPKLYAEQTRGTDVRVLLREALGAQLPTEVGPALGDSHITLMTSGPLRDLCTKRADTEEKLRSLIPAGEVAATFVSAVSTFSMDWEPCSFCFVVRITSPDIDAFLSRVNDEFSGHLAPSLHITYAAVLRK